MFYQEGNPHTGLKQIKNIHELETYKIDVESI